MADFPGPWWVAGGWAADLWVGEPTREHEDIEVGVPRSCQDLVHVYCHGWQFYTPVDNQWAPLPDDERLPSPRFMLQLRQTADTPVVVAGTPPEFEFLLNDVDKGTWCHLPNPGIRLPLEQVYGPTPLGPLAVRPHVLLLHKARYHRTKDEHDFRVLRYRLTAEQRTWLRTHLARLWPQDPWLVQLA